MKVLHTAAMSEPMTGVLRQMEMEQQSADKLGLQWRSSYFLGQSIDSPIVTKSPVTSTGRLRFKIAYYRWLYKTSKEYDVVLLRHAIYDPLELLFVLVCRSQIYSVHHTLEVPELIAIRNNTGGSKIGITLKLFAEKFIGAISLSLVDGVIGVLREIKDYNLGRRFFKRSVPSFVYTNGVEYYSDTMIEVGSQSVSVDVDETRVPVFLFVSSVYDPWQGLEELVAAASTYKKGFKCHVVGDLTDEQLKLLAGDDRFVAQGRLSSNEIAKLSTVSDVGLSILAAYKKNMKDIPALKVREYLKEGLAVYAGHSDVMPDDYRFYKCGPIDLEQMIEFAVESRNNDRRAISESARPYIEKEVILARLHEFLLENLKPAAK